eukprot:jgi/Chrzof1/1802/Cz10g21190.t1
MAPSKLNPQAPEFVPGSRFYGQECSLSDCFSNLSSDDYSEDGLTPEELDEIEAAEEWVATMADMEELEREHLIELALR